ncbi:MAG: NDP-sugar synthase [Myxococcota bacterium]|nr:NDP-sugar synthase [Myxococcota bacterium]
MRAMILAAGLGTRMAPLSDWRPKPALPVRGVPLIGYLLELLRVNGVTEVILNVHHRAEVMREAAERCCPAGIALSFSEEPQLLGTGGGILRAARFLRESETSLVLPGDMVLDTDLKSLIATHREREDAATLLLRADKRSKEFGPVGLDDENSVRRIGNDFDLGGSTSLGLFTSVRVFASRAYDSLDALGMTPDATFEDLRDWLAPQLETGARDIRGVLRGADELRWEPVGTLREYIDANFSTPALSYASACEAFAGRPRIENDCVIGDGASIDPAARLSHSIVWDGEQVGAAARGHDGVFANGTFHVAASTPA